MTTKPKTISHRQRALWAALNAFITRHGGWVTSQRDMWPLQMGCPFTSGLPAELEALGYHVASCGAITRVMHDGPMPVETFQIGLRDAQ